MRADIVRIILDLHQEAERVQILHDALSRLIAVQTGILSAVLIDRRVVVHDIDLGQTVALADLKVIGVMCRRDLDDTRPELHIDILVRDNGQFPVHERQHQLFAYQIPVSLILRVHRHSGIAEHRLRTGRREFDEPRRADRSVLLNERIFDVPEMTVLLLVFHLRVRERGVAERAPVDDPAAFVDVALLVHPDKDLGDGAVTAVIHGKTFSLPVTGAPQLL